MFYIVRCIKGKYYLYRVEYVLGKKKHKLIGNCEVIEELMNNVKSLKDGDIGVYGGPSSSWLGRRPDAARRRVVSHAESYNPLRSSNDLDLVVTEELIERFVDWCINKLGNNVSTCRDRANYLRKPLNIRNNHSVKAYRLLYKMLGREPPKELKVPASGVDLRVPSDEDVVESLRKAREHETLHLIYRLLIESGARLTEVVEVLRNYEPARDTPHDGFFTYTLSKQSKTKRSFYIFHLTPLKQVSISEDHITKLSRELGLVRPKHIRKWVATKMAELEVPTEIINFIQGRTPRTVLERNYLNLYALAIKYYRKYVEHLHTIFN